MSTECPHRVLVAGSLCGAAHSTNPQLLSELADRVTLVIVTHNMQQAHRVSQQCAFLLAGEDGAGRLVEVGSTSQIFTAPRDERTSDYVAGRFG